MNETAQNTDREIWRRNRSSDCIDDYYQPSIHATKDGGIGINVGGTVHVKSIEEWHRLAGGKLTLKDFERGSSAPSLREALSKIIHDEPHADTCGAVISDNEVYPCSCWQAKVLKALSVQKEETK